MVLVGVINSLLLSREAQDDSTRALSPEKAVTLLTESAVESENVSLKLRFYWQLRVGTANRQRKLVETWTFSLNGRYRDSKKVLTNLPILIQYIYTISLTQTSTLLSRSTNDVAWAPYITYSLFLEEEEQGTSESEVNMEFLSFDNYVFPAFALNGYGSCQQILMISVSSIKENIALVDSNLSSYLNHDAALLQRLLRQNSRSRRQESDHNHSPSPACASEEFEFCDLDKDEVVVVVTARDMSPTLGLDLEPETKDIPSPPSVESWPDSECDHDDGDGDDCGKLVNPIDRISKAVDNIGNSFVELHEAIRLFEDNDFDRPLADEAVLEIVKVDDHMSGVRRWWKDLKDENLRAAFVSWYTEEKDRRQNLDLGIDGHDKYSFHDLD